MLTRVEVTARDSTGRLLTNLGRDDFRLTQGSDAVPIDQFTIVREPVTAIIMVARSGDLDRHREIASAFVDTLGAGERLAIGSYGLEVAVSPLLTDDSRVLNRVLDEELWPGFLAFLPVETAVYRAVKALPHDAPRRAVILIGTDFRESCKNGSPKGCVDSATALRTAVQADVTIYGIITGRYATSSQSLWERPKDSPPSPLVPTEPLRKLAENTGGGFVRSRDLPPRLSWQAVAGDVFEQLRQRYVIGFGGERGKAPVTVQLSRLGAKVHVRALAATGKPEP